MPNEFHDFLRPVQQLLGKCFYVPNYQRGYRWRKEEVSQLLQDICDFDGSEGADFYCLQPLIVKPMADGQYEVIDGQQRLTTLQLIVHYFNLYLGGHYEDIVLCYQTRPDSSEVLQGLRLDEEGKAQLPKTQASIDYWHMARAFECIGEWMARQGEGFDTETFRQQVLEKTYIIWYETDEERAIKVFERNNIGKIGLTDAELIKALLLKAPTKQATDRDTLLRERLALAARWDEMEQELNAASFWAFIFGRKARPAVCMEEMFRLVLTTKKQTGSGKTLFAQVEQSLKDHPQALKKLWEEVCHLYDLYKDYYCDSDTRLYHYVGYLNAVTNRPQDVARLLLTHESRTALLQELEKSIRQLFANKLSYNTSRGFERMEVAKQKEENNNRKLPKESNDAEAHEESHDEKHLYGHEPTKQLLLLYNVLLCAQPGSNERFPFAKYYGEGKSQAWDVEHIDSQTENDLTSWTDQMAWLNEAKTLESLAEDVKDKIDQYIERKEVQQEKFDQLQEDIRACAQEDDDEGYAHSLGNLALLDAGTNRSYKNALFVTKRDRLRQEELKGTFVPKGTRIAFMKFFDGATPGLHQWSKADKQAHECHIYEYVHQFVEKR